VKTLSSDYKIISEILASLNEFIPSPACAYELKAYSKLNRSYKKLDREIELAGRMQKRSLKKNQDKIVVDMRVAEDKVLQCIFDTLSNKLKPNLDNQAKNILSIAPDAANKLRSLRLPLTPEIETIGNFLEELRLIYDGTISQIKNICKNALIANKSKIEAYSGLISLSQSSLQQTSSLTSETLDVMKFEGLVDVLTVLLREEALINQQLASSTDHVQEKLLQTIHDLTYTIQEGAKRNIITDLEEYDRIKELTSAIQQTNQISDLNRLWNETSKYISKYRSLYKSEISRVRTEGNNIIIQVRSMFPILSDKWMPVPPEIVTSGVSINELNQFTKQMDDWKKQILNGLKNIASVEELTRVNEGALQEGINIPNTIIVNAREIKNQIDEISDIDEAFKKLQSFHVFYNQFLDNLRENIKKHLSFDVTDSSSVSGGMIAIKPPDVNLKSTSPSDLLSYSRNVNTWVRNLVNTLQETRHAVNDTIATVKQLEKKGISVPPSLHTELSTLYNKMQSEVEIPNLLNQRRAYDRLYKEFVSLTSAFIKDFVKDVTILQLVEQEDVPKPPFVEDAGELDLTELLNRIDQVEKWKDQAISHLKRKIETFSFPMIPGEVPVDLRNEKNVLISQMSNIAATRNFVTTIRSYFDFINTMDSSKNTMIAETMRQKEITDKIDQSSMKYFGEIIGRAAAFHIPSDLEAMDNSGLMELWHRLNSFNKKKNELVQLKCKEILFNWQKQYKSLPAHYLDLFNPLFMIFDQALIDMNQPLEADQTFTRFEFFIDNAIRKAIESLEKLKALFYNQTTVSIPRITEIIGELSPEIHKIREFLESSLSHKGHNLETIHRLTVETIHDFEYVLIARLVELLSFSSGNLLKRIADLRNEGINIHDLVGEQIEVFAQLLQADTSEIMSIEMITQSFIELDKIMKNETLQKALFEIVDGTNTTAARISDTIQALGWKNAQQVLMPHVVAIKQARNKIQFWSFDIIAKAAVEVKKTVKEMIKALRLLEIENYDIYLTELNNDPNIPYYDSIQSVFEFRLEQCSRDIFPLNSLYDSRDKLQKTDDLNGIYDLLTTISKLKTQWKQEMLPVITRFHRVLFLFISDYKPTRVRDEKITFLANAKREIEEVYDHEPLVNYLSAAVEYYVENK
jgi:hypothetical protein